VRAARGAAARVQPMGTITAGPLSTTLVYELAGDGDGTSVRFSVTGRPTGLLRLMQPLIARATQRNLDQAFARLKRVLEAGP
jgi:carbon monoxide dehydrogenase subunit G